MRSFLLICFFFSQSIVYAQDYFQVFHGTTGTEFQGSYYNLSDGNGLFIGRTDVNGSYDFFATKFNNDFNILWSKIYGTSGVYEGAVDLLNYLMEITSLRG